MIKLGQVLHACELDEHHTKAGYRPRLTKSKWVVCKVFPIKGTTIKFNVSNGVQIKKLSHYSHRHSLSMKPNEVVMGFYKTEIAAVRALVEKKNPFCKHDDPEWADEWDKDQALLKRAIKKLRGE